ncbi:subtilisin-like protein, partial [Aulographum hederae CBS 113979]
PSTHQFGGERYMVVFGDEAENDPHIVDVLSALDLTPEHEDVRAVYNGTGFRGFTANMKAHCIDILNSRADVHYVEKIQQVKTYAPSTRDGSPWGLQRISSESAPAGNPMDLKYTYSFNGSNPGEGADIYIVDTGINTEHVAFEGRAKWGYNYPGSKPMDGDGHGSHCGGSAAANVFGVASKANLIAVKVLDDTGSGPTDDVVAGIEYVIDQHNARKQEPGFVGSVMSMSFGLTTRSNILEFAINRAIQAGVHPVIAAGNEGADSCKSSPAALGGTQGDAITVGSVNIGADVSSFSNTGACNDVYGPGETIVSTWIGGPNIINSLSGTSMAAPHVAGLVAYAMTQKPELAGDVKAMKSFIASSALPGLIRATEDNQPLPGDAMLLVNNGVT